MASIFRAFRKRCPSYRCDGYRKRCMYTLCERSIDPDLASDASDCYAPPHNSCDGLQSVDEVQSARSFALVDPSLWHLPHESIFMVCTIFHRSIFEKWGLTRSCRRSVFRLNQELDEELQRAVFRAFNLSYVEDVVDLRDFIGAVAL